MRCRRGDHDGDIADAKPADTMLDRDAHAGNLGFDLVAELGHHLDRHRRVGLVLEVIDRGAAAVQAHHAGERRDAAHAVAAHRGDAPIERQHAIGELDMAAAATRDRRDQRELVAIVQHVIVVDEVLIDRDTIPPAQLRDRRVALASAAIASATVARSASASSSSLRQAASEHGEVEDLIRITRPHYRGVAR